MRISGIYASNGELVGFANFAIDVTARKQEKKALQESEERYSTLFNESRDGIVLINADTGQIEDCNPSFEDLTARKIDELKEMKIWELCPPDKAELVRTTFEEKRDPRPGRLSKLEFQTPDGSIVPLEFISKLIKLHKKPVLLSNVRDISQRIRSQEQIERQIQRLGALREIDRAITGSLDLRVTINVLLDQVTSQLNVDAAAVLLIDPLRNLRYEAGHGFRSSQDLPTTRVRLGESYAGRAALERRILGLTDLHESEVPAEFTKLLSQNDFVDYRGIPLIAKGEVQGVLEVFNRAPIDPAAEWLEFFEALAGQAAIAVNNAGLFDNLQVAKTELEVAYDATLEGWVQALDMRDKETEGHTRRVTEVTLRLASAMDIPTRKLVLISRGALLHDIGKMAVPDQILHKPGPLTDEEWEIMRQHPEYARDFLARIDYLEPVLELSLLHFSEPTRQAEISFAVFCLKKKKNYNNLSLIHLTSPALQSAIS